MFHNRFIQRLLALDDHFKMGLKLRKRFDPNLEFPNLFSNFKFRFLGFQTKWVFGVWTALKFVRSISWKAAEVWTSLNNRKVSTTRQESSYWWHCTRRLSKEDLWTWNEIVGMLLSILCAQRNAHKGMRLTSVRCSALKASAAEV